MLATIGSPTNGVEYAPADAQKPLHWLMNGEFKRVPPKLLADLILKVNIFVSILVDGLLILTRSDTAEDPVRIKLLFNVNVRVCI